MIRPDNRYILFVLPALIFFVVIVVLPIFLTVFFSFIEWERFIVKDIGTLKHYSRLLTDPVLVKSFKHNFLYIGMTIILEVSVGLILAGIAYSMKRSMWFRGLIFAPIILPSLVIGVLWRQIYATSGGLLNTIFTSIGLESVVWLAPPLTIYSVSFVSGWIFAGFYMTIFYAGLSRIPISLLESAELDGADAFRKFFQIEIPLIKNLIMLSLLLVTTGGFKGFDLFQILLRRDPLQSGIVLPVQLVRTFFENRDIGYGSAISILLTFVVIIIMLIVSKISKIVGEVDEY